MEGSSGSSSNRKIVEVFIETDSESEAYSSSDVGEATESTLTAPEIDERGSDGEKESHVETSNTGVELCSPVSGMSATNMHSHSLTRVLIIHACKHAHTHTHTHTFNKSNTNRKLVIS